MGANFFKTVGLRIIRGMGFFLAVFLWTPSNFFAAGGHFVGDFDPNLGITIQIFPEGSSSQVFSMDFGPLVEFTGASGGKTLRSAVGFKVMIYPQPTGHIYDLYCTGGPLTNSKGNTIPGNACVVVPVYAAEDNNFGAGPTSRPSDSQMGSSGTWVTSSPHILYSSGFNGEYRAIQAHFSITDDPSVGAAAAVPVSQPAGHYSGTVTITISET